MKWRDLEWASIGYTRFQIMESSHDKVLYEQDQVSQCFSSIWIRRRLQKEEIIVKELVALVRVEVI